MRAFSAAAAESRRRRGDALWSPEAGLHTTSMTMRSGSSLRDCTARGPYTAASTTERSGGDGGGWGRVGGQPTRASEVPSGVVRGRGFASASPCSHRADPSARERNARSSLSCRIMPGVRPSARAADIVAKARGGNDSSAERASQTRKPSVRRTTARCTELCTDFRHAKPGFASVKSRVFGVVSGRNPSTNVRCRRRAALRGAGAGAGAAAPGNSPGGIPRI